MSVLSKGRCEGTFERNVVIVTSTQHQFHVQVNFPVTNSSGKVVAYSGRIIGEDEGKDGIAKYVNSPETPMYHKSSILYGYSMARIEIAKQKKVIVVELIFYEF